MEPRTRTTSKAKRRLISKRRPISKAKKVVRAAARPQPREPVSRAKLLEKLPYLWKFKTGAQAVGLWVDELVWAANDHGEIFVMTRAGTVERSYKLGNPVRCLLADEAWKYAGCDDGNVYDLTGRQPRALYTVDGRAGIDWLDMYRGMLCVSDNEGGLTVIDVEGEVRWKKRNAASGEGWMVRADGDGIFHGGALGVRKFDWNGKKQWRVDTGDVRFGWAEQDEVVVTGGYTRADETKLVVVGKDGKERLRCSLDPNGPRFHPTGAESCGAGTDASGARRYFASAGGFLFCWDGAGEMLWRGPTGCGSACTMQLVGDTLYLVTTNGTIAALDVSAAALEKAGKGSVVNVKTRRAAKVKAASNEVERTSDTSKGVVLECVKDGSKVRVRVISDGFHANWFVQFPRDLRQVGSKFVVDEVREATQGGFYRVLGDIRRLR